MFKSQEAFSVSFMISSIVSLLTSIRSTQTIGAPSLGVLAEV
jgi:hypothetical protein